MGKLDRILAYDLIGKLYNVPTIEQNKLDANPPILNTDWEKSFCSEYKKNLKKFFSRRQNRRCAYCRVIINVDGYTDPIEHIMPRIHKPKWMFLQHNLVVSCGGCNSSKGTNNVLINNENDYGFDAIHCPTVSSEYKIFNPHFDRWEEHFEIQDDFFLVPKPNTKGPHTYDECNMRRYQIIIDHRDQLSMREERSFKNLTKRLKKEKDTQKILHLEKAKEYVLDMIENN